MTWSFRRVAAVLTATAVLGSFAFLQHANAQKKLATPPPVATPGAPGAPAGPPAPKDEFEFSGISLVKDSNLKSQVEAANDYIQAEDWVEACRVLQKLIDRPDDVFVPVPRTNPDGKEVTAWVSVKKEANRLLANLPEKGKDFYKLTYGPKAATLLADAKAKSDPALMAQIAKFYLYTDAGLEATNWLASYMLDRGEYTAANLHFRRLIDRQGLDKVPTKTLFKAAYAFHQVDNRADEKLVRDQLSARSGEVALGKETKSVSELQEFIDGLARASFTQNVSEWYVYGGGPGRNAQGNGGTAFMDMLWKQPTVQADETTRFLKQAERHLEGKKQPVLPAFYPVTAVNTSGGKRQPLLIFRSYWGIHAVHMKTGKLAWDSPSSWSLDRTLARGSDARKIQAMTNWLNYYVNQQVRPQIIFENSVLGALSTDSNFVYAVEDLAVPPNVVMNNNFNPGYNPGMNFGAEVNDAIQHNRLQAFELATNGKLKWELGGRGNGPLEDTYFLGPPLPLGGKLFVLTEKQQELRLVALNPSDGKVLSSQVLCTTRDKLQQDITRRTHASHLAYGEGILVCPTNAGAVFGIDLLSGSLVWAYPYREKGDVPEPPQMDQMRRRGGIPPGFMMMPDGRIVPIAGMNTEWKVSAPVIADGKVVFTAPDAKSVHCLNLADGTPVWSQRRNEDDLYMAGVFAGKVLIVGKKAVRGLSLAKGEQLFNLETGTPSGQGIASDNVYYLPLKEATRSKEPEICAIDMERGIVAAHTRSRKKDVPGNLVFFEGDVISQTATDVIAYPQLKVKIAQMDERIAKNPNDPEGLVERGELRLDKGDLGGAIADLRAALRNKPAEEVRDKARAKLFDAMTEHLQRDFNAAEGYLKEYEELCTVSLDGARDEAEKAERLAETRKRKGNYLCLVAKGREAQGRLVEAFEKYREFGELAGKQELISVVDEPAVKAAPDVWSQGRIAAMVAKAKPEHRKPLEDMIQKKWAELHKSQDVDVNEVRNFVKVFGSLFDVGKEARLYLAERLMEERDPNALLEAEQQLALLRGPKEKPELAARAVEALARLCTRKGLLEDAAYYYDVLGKKYADVVVRDGLTGAKLLQELATDKRFLPYLERPVGLKVRGKITATEERGSFPYAQQVYHFPQAGEPLPFFKRNRLALHFGYHKLQLLDGSSGEERWGTNLTRTMFQQMMYANGQSHLVRFPFQSVGHLVVLPVGHMVFGIDPVGQRKLWEKDLVGNQGIQSTPNGPQYQNIAADPRDGSLQIYYADGWMQRLGGVGNLEGAVLFLQTHEALLAVDPLTGRTLWTRSDVNNRNHIFSDEDTVYVVEVDQAGNPTGTRAFRSYDGVTVRVADFTSVYAKRVRMFGRNILASAPDAKNQLTLRLYDVAAGKDLWSQSYPAGSLALNAPEGDYAGAVEPNGLVRVTDLRTGKEVLKARMSAEHLAGVQQLQLLADADNFYVACVKPTDGNVTAFGGVRSNLMPGTGLRALPVNGEVYAFAQGTGKLRWYASMPDQMLVLDRFDELPVVLFTATYQKWIINGAARHVQQVTTAHSIEKRTGKRLYGNDQLPNGMQFHTLHVDARSGTIDFTGYQLKITHHLNGPPKPGAAQPTRPGVGAAPYGGRSGLAPQPQQLERIKVRRAALERLELRVAPPPLPVKVPDVPPPGRP
jgi:outer membrane protein assembly factor BamB